MTVRPAVVLAAVLVLTTSCGGETMERPAVTSPIDRSLIELPHPDTVGEVPLEEALQRRRSIREFSAEQLELSEVAQLLWAAQGVTAAWGGRTAPSAGATYPLEVYIAVSSVRGLAPGVYRYRPDAHALVAVHDRRVADELADACLGQDWIAEAPIQILVVAVYERTTARYGERGRRYVLLEAGHAAQNLLLESTSLGLGAVTVGAFDDEAVSSVVGLAAGESPVYVVPVGRPRDGAG